jgi:hypothetical protein
MQPMLGTAQYPRAAAAVASAGVPGQHPLTVYGVLCWVDILRRGTSAKAATEKAKQKKNCSCVHRLRDQRTSATLSQG